MLQALTQGKAPAAGLSTAMVRRGGREGGREGRRGGRGGGTGGGSRSRLQTSTDAEQSTGCGPLYRDGKGGREGGREGREGGVCVHGKEGKKKNPDSVSVPSPRLAFPFSCFREEGGGGGRRGSMTWIVVKLGGEEHTRPSFRLFLSPSQEGRGEGTYAALFLLLIKVVISLERGRHSLKTW